MEPGDWKYAAAVLVMVLGLGLVALSVPRMDAARARATEEYKAADVAALIGDKPEYDRRMAAGNGAEREGLAWGAAGVVGAMTALLALLSLFVIGVRGPEGRGGVSRAAVKAESRPKRAAARKKRGGAKDG